ncbi:MAG TPA: ABC transporter permease, partial [Segetibacter sp.]|nr:ABC transporter permease [Segetibacter sp.]
VAWRNLLKNKFYASVNVIGLASGLAIGLIILLWVHDELSYDGFHSKAKYIYRVNTNIGTGTSFQSSGITPAPIMPYSKSAIPEVSNAVRIADNYDYSLYKYQDKQFTETKAAYIDPSFFTIFDFKLLKGDRANPFRDNNSIILTATTAKKYFDNDDPIGKIILADNKDNYSVRGVMEDFPENSSIKYDMLFPIDILKKNFTPNEVWKSMEEDWGNYYYQTFLLLHPNASSNKIEKKLTQLQREHNQFDKSSFYTLQPLEKIHLIGADGSSSALQTVNVFLTVAVLLLLIACINYVNLSTARSMLRAKEVSVRKIVGAAKVQLFIQFIIETALLFTIAAILAIGIIYLLIPLYNNISGKNTTFSLADTNVWKTFFIAITGTLVVASVYPALLLSSFKPVLALKGKISIGIGNTLFRKILVVTQFVFSVALIISTLIIGRQLRYIQEKELGYNKSHVFSFDMREMQKHYDAVKAELSKQPGIVGVAAANADIVQLSGTTGDTKWYGKEENTTFLIHPISVDKNFIPLMQLHFAAGNNFTGNPSDSTHYILNETAIREMELKDPVGKRFALHNVEGTIIGVVKDFHSASLKQKIEPVVFSYRIQPENLYIRTSGRDAAKAIALTEKLWKRYNPSFPFQYHFLDETYDNLYKSDQRTGSLFNVFAAIAIFISCLGLFGLATYTAQIKTKEIGIRKVLGATVLNVTGLLAKDFIKLVLIAFVIASPVAWWVMNKWLQDFAYRVSTNWSIFALAGLIAMLIAVFTVSLQAIKAAIANPVKSLRTE